MAITLEDAVALIERHTKRLPARVVPVLEAVGCALAEDITAPIENPPFCRSPLDGYALCAADTANATREHPASLAVLAKYFAGDEAVCPVRPGQAVRVMTGGMLPPGADCVVRQEDTDCGADTVRVFISLTAGQNICMAGEDYHRGEPLFSAGMRLDAAGAAVAATAGLTALAVFPRPRVQLLSTGDELTAPGQPLLPGKIYNANPAYLGARLLELGLGRAAADSCKDGLDALCAKIQAAVNTADVLLLTGGVSVGERDLVPAALTALGAKILFHGVAIKPGMPALFAVLKDTPVLALSGNPFAAAVSFELLCRPLLAMCSGNGSLLMKSATAVLQNEYVKKSPTRRFLRGREDAGRLMLPAAQANGQMRSMAGCNCLAEINAGSGALTPGTKLKIWYL